MKTEESLLAIYGPTVSVEKACRNIFNVNYQTAKNRIAANKWPIATFKLLPGNRNPDHMHITDIAQYIDAQMSEATRVA